MLDDLDEVPWRSLTHAYGDAEGIPARIRTLTCPDPAQWVRALGDLHDALCHQMCSIYPATTAAIPFLVELLGSREVRCRGGILQLLGDVAFVAIGSGRNGQARDDEARDNSTWDESSAAVAASTREALWQGHDTYLELLIDLDPRVRVEVPYLLGTLAAGDELEREQSIAEVTGRMRSQFEEEPNELVRASLVFGVACCAPQAPQITPWLECRVSDAHSGPAVRMAAALKLAEARTVSNSVLQMLVHGLENPDETNRLFRADGTPMENRHDPIGRATLALDGPLDDRDDSGREEDMKFPWCDRWQSRWVTFRILKLLSELELDEIDRLVPALVPYLEQANEFTGDSLVPPILEIVFGDRKLSLDSRPEDLSPHERSVLLPLFQNIKLWSTNMHQAMFEATGLGNRRSDWARVLGAEPHFSASQIQQILRQKMDEQGKRRPDEVQQMRLCRVGSREFLPHLREHVNLRLLDLADTPISDEDLTRLADFPHLRMLRLNNTLVSDAGVASLDVLTNLEELYLPGTRVSDRCLDSLGKLPCLRYVSLSNTAVTEDAALEFMDRHADCRISR